MNLLVNATVEKLLGNIEKLFPNDSLRVKPSTKDGYCEKAVVVVDEMDNYHLQTLYMISEALRLDVKLKRSGTGISITFTAAHLD